MSDYGICNVTYRLDKIERLLFELDYEVMDVNLCKFLLITNIESHKRAFSPCALLVTSSSPLKVDFIIKAMLGEKKTLYILTQQISGNRACIYASDFGH